MDHNTGDCEVLKAQASKICANWETHRSKYRHNNKHNCNNNYNDLKKSKTCEEVNAVEDDDFKDHVRKIVREFLPQNPKNKKQRNKNLNVKEFNRLNLSDNESDSEEEGEE